MHPLWKRLFQRQRILRSSVADSYFIPVYFLVIFGKRRSRLTRQNLATLQSDSNRRYLTPVDRDAESIGSFYSCFSTFEDPLSSTSMEDIPLLSSSDFFRHYISHSHLKRLAAQGLAKMQQHFSNGYAWNDQDTMGKYLCPGLGWDVRPDETGPRVLSMADMSRMAGNWRTDMECSDDPGILLDLMEMPWYYKKAARLVHHTEVRANDEKIGLYARVLGLTFPTVSYWSREGRITPRRDLRKGFARISTVPTTFGFRQLSWPPSSLHDVTAAVCSVQWGQPFAGFSVVECQISADANAFEFLTYTQRYDGPHCCLRSVFRRVVK